MPFHHLATSGIWQPLTADGKASPDRKLTAKVRLDPAFLSCLRDGNFRDKAKRVLIETPPYFRRRRAHRSLRHAAPQTGSG